MSTFINATLTSALIAIALGGYILFANAVSHTRGLTDGPYVFLTGQSASIQWLCNSTKFAKKLARNALPFTFNECGLTADIRPPAARSSQLVFEGDFPVAAVSDFHGQYQIMHDLMINNGIIDSQGHWAFGNGHLVITGDVFDRGDRVTEILWFLYRLEQQAQRQGGKLHLLLGNHEVMILNNDLRYLHSKYIDTSKILDIPYPELYSKHSLLGQWLRSKSVLVKVNDMLFAHGGFNPELASGKRSLAEISQAFSSHLVKAELPSPRAGFAEYLHGSNGPVWYRGYFKSREHAPQATEDEIDSLLAHFQIKRIVVGHTTKKRVEASYGGKVIAIDSGIKYGTYGEMLLVDEGGLWRGTLSGEKKSLNFNP